MIGAIPVSLVGRPVLQREFEKTPGFSIVDESQLEKIEGEGKELPWTPPKKTKEISEDEGVTFI